MTRLVAELISCPVKGFFGQPDNPEIAIEGSNRQSNYLVFKGHQTFHKVCQKIQHKHLIYVVRDVRVLAISGANFFKFYPSKLDKYICKSPLFGNFYYNNFISENTKINQMIRVLDQGEKSVPCCYISWEKHVIQYLNNGVLVIKYEYLLLNPEAECQKILSNIGIERSKEQIAVAVKNQSFGTIKEKFKLSGDRRRENFLREGKSSGWKQKFTAEQKHFVKNRFFDTLSALNYLD
ncbi:MAG: sulfotransferase domain-containing protein [Okeania sp. SIO2D1]|nr:sulfotransferase domain-containing protein [Okeania sp. SIO2D1]